MKPKKKRLLKRKQRSKHRRTNSATCMYLGRGPFTTCGICLTKAGCTGLQTKFACSGYDLNVLKGCSNKLRGLVEERSWKSRGI